MSDDARTSSWGHHALNLALLALGVALMALLYALVSQHLGGASPAGARSAGTGGGGPAAPSTGTASGAAGREIVQVGVRNGCGVSGLAATARSHLMRSGFDVVEVGNYSTFDVDSSMVIDRVGNRTAAQRVARAMGIPPGRVREEIGEAYYLDASVVIGADYRSLKPFDEQDDDRPAVP